MQDRMNLQTAERASRKRVRSGRAGGCDYTRGTGSIAVGGSRLRVHAAIAYAMNDSAEEGMASGIGWPRKPHADKSAGTGSPGNGAAPVCFDSFSPAALMATGTCRYSGVVKPSA